MNAIEYWPMARKHSMWNTAVSALEFWTADLTTSTLKDAIQVYTTFFYTSTSQIFHQYSDESLFGLFGPP